MKTKLLVIVVSVISTLNLTSCATDTKSTSWKYVGTYYCNYDVFQPNFYQTTTLVEVYYKPYQGNLVYYGVKDDSGSILSTTAGSSDLHMGGHVNFRNFKKGNDIGIISLRIEDLPMQYWTHD